jgi:hypothetical protein
MLYMFVLRAKIATTFKPKMVEISARNTYTKHVQTVQTSQGYIFQALQHFANKRCNFTNFSIT